METWYKFSLWNSGLQHCRLIGDCVEERDIFEGLSKERLERALSILYSNEDFDVRVKLIPKEEKQKAQAATCTKPK